MYENESIVNSPVSLEHKEFLRKTKKKKITIFFTQIFILIAFFVLWEIAANLKWIDTFIFSQPSRIFSSMMVMLIEGKLMRHIAVTLGETAVGFVLGTALGIITAVILWWNSFIERVLDPYLVVLNSLPKTALAPILIVWLGNNVKSIIVTALMISVITTVITVLTGFLQVDKEKIKLIKTFGGSKSQILFKLIMPSNVPVMISALKINVGLSFVGVIVGEFLVAQEGLGYLIVYGSQVFKMDWVMMSIIILCALAALLYQLIVMLEKKFSDWLK